MLHQQFKPHHQALLMMTLKPLLNALKQHNLILHLVMLHGGILVLPSQKNSAKAAESITKDSVVSTKNTLPKTRMTNTINASVLTGMVLQSKHSFKWQRNMV